MSNLHLYPTVRVAGKSFSKEKVLTVPNQSMSLRDILLRFTRRESLPVEREGFYADNLGDLEKMGNEDITVRKEKAAAIRQRLHEIKREHEAKASANEGVPVESPSVPGNPPKGT